MNSDLQFNEKVFEEHMKMMSEREKMLASQDIKIFRVSTTERDEFKDCRRKWDFGSFSRQGIEPKRPHVALSFGTAIHHALEMFYSGQCMSEGLLPEQMFDKFHKEQFIKSVYSLRGDEIPKVTKDTLEDQLDLALEKADEDFKKEFKEVNALGRSMLEGYVTWSSKEDYSSDAGFQKVLYTEKEFCVIITNEGEPYRFIDAEGQEWEMWLVGRLDMVVLDWDNRIWILDHKTSKDKLDKTKLVLDDQMTMYIWAAQQILGIEIEGCYYNVLRKKLPRVPEPLVSKKGLSKAKSIDTTYDVYYQAIVENGFNPEDYRDILEHLMNTPNTFFERAKVRRNQHEILVAGHFLLQEAVDMLNDPFIYPHSTWDCNWKCDYKELCHAINRNDDVAWMKEAMFQKRNAEGVYDRESTIE